MTVGQKASLSLLIAVVIFAACAVAAFSGLFDVIETEIRNPILTKGIETSLAKVTEAEGRYHETALERFSAVLRQDPVRRSFLPNISAQDAFDRANILGKLQEETAGLAGLRLIDANGKRIHYSSFPGDILKKTETQVVYRNYGSPGDDPYESLAENEASKGRVRITPARSRFVYSLPFTDSYGMYRGTAVFEVSIDGFVSSLIKEGLAPVGETVIAAGDRGLILKAPSAIREALTAKVLEVWSSGLGEAPVSIAMPSGSGESYLLFSRAVRTGGFVGYVIPDSYFKLPWAMKAVLLGSLFITIYLIAFLLLNIRQDRMAVLAHRIKRFQISLLQEYIDNKAEIDFDRWRRELEGRRSEVRDAIRRGVGSLRSGKSAEIDELIDKSWDEILAVLGGRAEQKREVLGLREIEKLLGELVKSGSLSPPPPTATVGGLKTEPASEKKAPSPAQTDLMPQEKTDRTVHLVAESNTASEPEDIEVIEEAEALEEVEEASEAEVLEEVEEASEAEALEEVEEASEAEALEEVEEASEAEVLEEVEEASEAEALEEVEEVSEAEVLEEAEEIESIDEKTEAPVPVQATGRSTIKPVALRYADEIGTASTEPLNEAKKPSLPESVEELEELEESEEIEELEQIGEEEAVELTQKRATSEQAYELALDQNEDIPVIPESTGLELSDEADVSEIIGFIDIDDHSDVEDLDLLDMDGASGNPDLVRTRTAEIDEGPEFILDAAEQVSEDFEAAEEMEFELLLSSIDLSSLEQWGEGQKAETGERSDDIEAGEEPEFLLEPRFLLSEAQADANEAGDDVIVNGEIPMLNSQMRDLLEILPAADLDEGPPVEITSYLGPWTPCRVFGSADTPPVFEELPVVGEGDAWSEAEYLEPFELSRYVDLPDNSQTSMNGEDGDSDGDDAVIVFHDGLYTLNKDFSNSDRASKAELDPDLRGLVDSVLSGQGT